MSYSVAQAAQALGKSKTTILRAIASGRISATRDAAGVFRLDPAELHRGFPEAQHAVQHEPEYAPQHGAPRREDLAARLAAAEAENTALHAAAQMRNETISDLRHRLDQSDADWRLALDRLAAAQERIAALLTDQRQPARRSWWRWR